MRFSFSSVLVLSWWKPYQAHQWYIPWRSGAVSGGVYQVGGRRAASRIGGRAATADDAEAPSTAVHHGVAERTSRRAVQEKVGGEVGVEEILEDVLCHEERIAGLVVGMQL